MRTLASFIRSAGSLLVVSVVSACLAGSLVVPTLANATVTLIARGTDQNGTLLLPGHLLSPGDQVTVEVTGRNDGQQIFGLGASATGYDSNGFQFNSGQTVDSIFNRICIDGLGCLGGLDQGGADPAFLTESPASSAGVEVQFFNALSFGGTTGPGDIDPGVSGIVGDPQARLVFDVAAATVFDQQGSIHIGSLLAFGDALVLAGGTFGVVETVWVVPEPGTALLLGFGLAGLACRRRAESR